MILRNRYMFFWLAILSLIPAIALARLELSVVRPLEEFVTNNKELVIEGRVKHEEARLVTVSVNTPAGVVDLGSFERSLYSLTVDAGSVQSLRSLIFFPVYDGNFSFGPRVVNLSFSRDGQNYENRGTFNCTSGTSEQYGEALADFGTSIDAKFVRIDMLEGWQKDRISIHKVGFIDSSGRLINGKIRGLSIALDPYKTEDTRFQIAILLREGENLISIFARAFYSVDEMEEDFMLVRVVYIPEVVVELEPVVLSDGYKAELVIPAGALKSNIKKIGINLLDTSKIEWASYSGNVQIAKGTLPVLAYKVDVGVKTPFPVTAKDYLERQPPSLVVDDNTDYPSTWITAFSPLPVWLKIDLRTSRTISKVSITPRVKGDMSYGPKKLSILVSDDDVDYEEIIVCEECDDRKIEIELSSMPTARYIQILIQEGKQGNNIQINDVELRDEEGTRIVSYTQRESVTLAWTAELRMFYDDSDLITAGIRSEKNLAVFSWIESTREWRMVGGIVDTAKNMITVNLNYLSTFAIFEASFPIPEIRWSYNPFSPNGDGVADTTTISINIGEAMEMTAKVEIYDYTGKIVKTLIHEDNRSGHISIVWDGRDENGDRVAIGPYLYQVSIGKEVRNGLLIVAR